MSAHQARFRIATMARVLGVSTSGYYAWRQRRPPARRRCCEEHREGMMAHRRRVSSARPASRSPACPHRAPYHRRALWTCPAYGRPVRSVLHPQVGDTGAHSPLEISRATAGDQAGAEAARFPQVHSAFLSIYSHGKPRHDLNPKALTCPQNRGNLKIPRQGPELGIASPRIRLPSDLRQLKPEITYRKINRLRIFWRTLSTTRPAAGAVRQNSFTSTTSPCSTTSVRSGIST